MHTPDVRHLPLKIIHDLPHPADILPEDYRKQVTDVLRDLRARASAEWLQMSPPSTAIWNPTAVGTVFRAGGHLHRRGMRLWVYDERGYPSGGAGGVTLRDYPDGEAQGVVCITARVMPGETGCIPCPTGTGASCLPVCMPATRTGTFFRTRTDGMRHSARIPSGTRPPM